MPTLATIAPGLSPRKTHKAAMSSNTPDFIASFATASPQERRTILSQLAEKLHPSDWWYLNTCLRQNGYHYDIFGSLPLELVILIIKNLSPKDLCLNRRVSKRWNKILTSEPLCRAAVYHYFSQDVKSITTTTATAATSTSSSSQHHHPPLLILGEDDKKRLWRILFENSASRLHFFRTARPAAATCIDIATFKGLLYYHSYGKIATSYNKTINSLAFSNTAGLVVVNLDSEKAVLPTTLLSNREWGARDLFLTSSHVLVMSGLAKGYIYNLTIDENQSFRLPSSLPPGNIAGDEEWFLMAYPSAIYIRDAVKKRTREINVTACVEYTHWTLAVDSTRKVFWLVDGGIDQHSINIIVYRYGLENGLEEKETRYTHRISKKIFDTHHYATPKDTDSGPLLPLLYMIGELVDGSWTPITEQIPGTVSVVKAVYYNKKTDSFDEELWRIQNPCEWYHNFNMESLIFTCGDVGYLLCFTEDLNVHTVTTIALLGSVYDDGKGIDSETEAAKRICYQVGNFLDTDQRIVCVEDSRVIHFDKICGVVRIVRFDGIHQEKFTSRTRVQGEVMGHAGGPGEFGQNSDGQ